MDVFAFREELIAEYARFSRSFTRIRAEGIARKCANSGTSAAPQYVARIEINASHGSLCTAIRVRRSEP